MVVIFAVAAFLDVRATAQLVAPQFAVGQGNAARTDVGMDGAGGFVYVWESAYTIWGMRYAASGAELNGPTPLGVAGGAEGNPKVAMAANGSFLVIWQDWGTDFAGDVHGRRFASNGAPLTAEFRINTYTSSSQFPGDVAVSPSGSMLVVWSDPNDGSNDGIYAQRLSASGAPVASQFRVNTTTTFSQRTPIVAAAGQGFVVAWSTYVNGNSYDLAGQVFNASGMPVGAQIQVNGFVEPFPQQEFAITGDGAGRFVLVWTDINVDEPSTGVYAQRFDASGVRLGSQFRVNAITTSGQLRPTVHADSAGRFVVAYFDNIGSAVRLREFSSGGVPEADEVTVAASTQGFTAPIHGNAAGDAVIAWGKDDGFGGTVLFGRRLALSPNALGPELRVNAAVANHQREPAIATGSGFVVAWVTPSGNYGWGDVMVQRFSPNGVPVGGQAPITDVFVDDHQPAVGMDANGEFVVAWRSAVFGYNSIAVARFNVSGTKLGSTDYLTSFGTSPDVDRNAVGAFVIVWSEGAGGGNDIVGQRFGPTGTRFGGPFRVNVVTAGAQTNPRVALDASGSFIVVWESIDEDPGTLGIYGQRFSAAGLVLGPQFRVNNLTLQTQDLPDVAAASNGEFVVVWHDDVSFTLSIQGQRFASTGIPLGHEFRVNVESGARGTPRVAYNRNEGFAVLWTNGIPDNQSHARLFRRGGSPLGTEFGVGLIRDAQYSGVPVAAFEGASTFDVVWQDDEDLGNLADIKVQQFTVRFCVAGDANGDGAVNVSDVLYLINNLFAGGPIPTSCGNVNGDLSTNVTDVLYLINYLFAGGPLPT